MTDGPRPISDRSPRGRGAGGRLARLSVLGGAAALALAACGASGKTAATTTVPATSSTTATTAGPSSTTAAPTTAAAPATFTLGATFYQDDFKTAAKGWPVANTADVSSAVYPTYATPLYAVTVKTPNTAQHPHPEFRGIKSTQLQDYAITAEIQTTLSVGSKDDFGVTCRDLNRTRYQMIMGRSLDRTHSWQISKYDGTNYTTLAHGTLDNGGSAFTVTGVCLGGHNGSPAQLYMQVNGATVGSATDSDHPLAEGFGGVYLDTSQGNSAYNILSFAAASATAP